MSESFIPGRLEVSCGFDPRAYTIDNIEIESAERTFHISFLANARAELIAGRPDTSLSYLDVHPPLDSRVESSFGRQRWHQIKADAYIQMGDFDLAVTHCRAALEIGKQVDLPEQQLYNETLICTLAEAQRRTGDISESTKAALLEISEGDYNAKNFRAMAVRYAALRTLALSLGNNKEARISFLQHCLLYQHHFNSHQHNVDLGIGITDPISNYLSNRDDKSWNALVDTSPILSILYDLPFDTDTIGSVPLCVRPHRR